MAAQKDGACMENWLCKMERKYGRFAISNLMYILSGCMFVVFLADVLTPGSLYSLLYLNMNLVARGQIWRLITFIFLPPSSSPVWILFSLYFYCLIGHALEQEWGSFRLNMFYLFGMLGTVIGAIFTGGATNDFLNMSLFLAFACIYPDFSVLLFFIIPIKVKYLALIDALYFVIVFIMGTASVRISVIMSLLNLVLFFGKDFFTHLRRQAGYQKTRRNFRKTMNNR